METHKNSSRPPREVALVMETTLTLSRNMLRGIRRYMSEHQNWSVILETGICAPAWLSSWQGDGIISRSWGQEMVDMIGAKKLPTVEVRHSQTTHLLPFVGVDNRTLGSMVARHFLEKGFRRFGCFAMAGESFVIERRNYFEQHLGQHGFQTDFYLYPDPGVQRPSASDQNDLVDWLHALPKPCGIFACTDRFGFTLLDVCRKAGIAVPEEIAVVGVGDDESLCEMSSPPLSSVHFAAAKIGYQAATLLDHLMDGGKPPDERVLIPPIGINARKSSDIVAVEDPAIARALRFIRERVSEGLSVDEVAAGAGIARRTLERRMRLAIGRTPQEELLRVKLERARILLAETALTLEEIAFRAGFNHMQYLSLVFRKTHGVTPGQYRKSMQVPYPDANVANS